MSKDAYWFRHDSNASRDPKIMVMKSIYGFEGYGMYWAIIEALREQPDYRIKIGGKYGYQALAGMIGATADRLEEFISDCVNEFELLQIEGEFLGCISLDNRMKLWEVKKANGSKGGRPKKTESKPKKNLNNNLNETESKPSNRTEENRTEENNTEQPQISKIIPPQIEWVTDYFKEQGFSELQALEFFEYWSGEEWKRKGNQLMKNWKSTALNKMKKLEEWGQKPPDPDDYIDPTINPGYIR